MSVSSRPPRSVVRATLVAVSLTVAAGCGGVSLAGPDPEPVATEFAELWTAGKCAQALEKVADADAGWRASCRDAFAFAVACEDPGGAGNPSEECGPGTAISVREVRVRETTYADDEAHVRVVVAWTRGEHTRREKTRTVVLREADGVWRVTNYS